MKEDEFLRSSALANAFRVLRKHGLWRQIPLSLALVLDVSDSMRGPRMDDARSALLTFAEDLLKPEDEAALLAAKSMGGDGHRRSP